MSLPEFFIAIAISSGSYISYAGSDIDTSTVRNLLETADSLCSIHPDSALLYSQKAVHAAPFVNDRYFVSRIYKNHAKVFYFKSLYDSSAFFLKKAMDNAPPDEPDYLADLYNNFGSISIMQNRFDTALFFIQKALAINENHNKRKHLISNYANLGTLYRRMGAYDISTHYIYKGLPIAEELKDTTRILKFLQTMGYNYWFMKKHGPAIKYCNQALEYSLATNNYKRASELTNTIAEVYRDLEQFDKAMRYFQISSDYAKRVNFPAMEAVSLLNTGILYADKNLYDSAMIYLAKGDSIAQKNNYINIIIAADIYYGRVYTETKQYGKALTHLLNAIEDRDKGESSLITGAYLKLSKVYENLGDYAKAYNYHVLYSQRNDSAVNKQKTDEIANIRMQYELNKKQEQLDAELKAEAKRYRLIRNITILGVIAILIISALLVITYRSRQKQKLYDLKNEINSYRQRLMTQQINPHFIFNTLNSIQYFIYNNKKEESMDFVSQFAQLMRLNLYNSQNDIIALKDEIEALKIYLELERVRLDNKFDYDIEIDPAIDIEKQLVPSFLIQPLVENSIKHGIMKLEHKGDIQTKIIRNNGNLTYTIIDNGIGFEKSKDGTGDTKHISYGLELTKKRLLLIGILNNAETDFTFTEIKKKDGKCAGTRVEIVIPSTLRSI